VPLQAQVAAPVFTLAAAGPGEHVMTIDISPENLGPITVRAHVGAEGVRVELFAPTDLSREALRAILPDIRKDMTGAGLGGTLDLSSQNQPADRGDERGRGRREPSGETGVELEGVAGPARPWMLADPTATIDVMA
jgi:flagellar hook-length control protein FliK